MKFNTFDAILQSGETADEAIEYLHVVVWCECGVTTQSIGHYQFVESYEGVSLYYNYAGDYYFFVDDTES